MQRFFFPALTLICSGGVLASEVTPVQKVIQLMDEMKAKGEKEMKEEAAQYAKYERFCEDTLLDKKRSIARAEEKMAVLDADIKQATSDIERLTTEITELDEDIKSSREEQDKASKVRKKERDDFAATFTDYTESIDAIGRAVNALKENNKKHSFVQLSAVRSLKNLPGSAVDSIDAYLSDTSDIEPASLLMESSQQPPAPKTYEVHSNGVVKMLEGLQDKFVEERQSLEAEEAKTKHAYEMMMQSMKAQEAQDVKYMKQNTGHKNKEVESKAAMESDLEETTGERDADAKYRADLVESCKKKAFDMASRTKLRQEELEAIAKATQIISETVAGKAEKHLRNFLQIKSQSAVLVFLRSEGSAREHVARLLQQASRTLGSRVLAAAAVRVREDPIAKVKDMIITLVARLRDQISKAADKKAECDLQLTENKATREDKTDTVDELKSEIDALTSTIAHLTDDMETLTDDVNKLQAAMKNATELRAEEKAKNTATIKDAKEAQDAVARALRVLEEFYVKAGEATSLVQQSTSDEDTQPEPPETFDETYNGMGGEQGGVVGMLEVIQSDFARLDAETTAEELKAKKEYETFMEDSKIDKEEKLVTIENKKRKKLHKSQDLTTAEADLVGTQKELDAAMETFEKLKATCLPSGPSFKERQEQRAKEIKELQGAVENLQAVNGG